MRLSQFTRVLVAAPLIASLLFVGSGCSLFVGKMQAVRIAATDPGAKIYVDGIQVGTGSVSMRLDRRRSHTVIAKADGRTGAAAINKKVSAIGVIDIVGGIFFLVPFLGILGAGFWELDPDDVTVYVQ